MSGRHRRGELPALEPTGALALITGAAGGMGEHLAKGWCRRGGDVVLLDRDAEGLARVAAEIDAQAPAASVTTYPVDLADRTATDAVVAEVVETHPEITLLVNNAGVALGGTFEQTSPDDFDWLLEINLLAPIRITRAVLPFMLDNRRGHVVNTSSLFGLVGPPGQTAYCTSKFGLRGFSESLRSELDEEERPVGVTVVHPGGIKTGIAENARVAGGVDEEEAARNKRAFAKMLTYPADRAAEEIIEAALARRPRLLIGRDAKALDVIARANPARYWSLMSRAMALAAKR